MNGLETNAVAPRPAGKKSQSDLDREWDTVAQARFDQLRTGQDITYSEVLLPLSLSLAEVVASDRVIDAGCGPGFLTRALGARAMNVLGVDPSRAQVALANAHNGGVNIEYVATTLEALGATDYEPADVVIANMTLMDVLSLPSFLSSAHRLLKTGGRFIATITHPCFWPSYWGYDRAPWFRYSDEIAIEAPFTISLAQGPIGVTTHVHRPLASYISALADSGLILRGLREPMPTHDIESRYPQAWKAPRYLALSAMASSLGLCG